LELTISEAIKLQLDRKKKTLATFASELNMSIPTFRSRIRRGGWKTEELQIIEKELGIKLNVEESK
jgi:hypothetical protein